ncbi:hypothetical protein GJ496_001046 [Pomphorhynchus laevis]|nr:hypothetical protein GJ496_001046 [Pomphorhynchus laevis]
MNTVLLEVIILSGMLLLYIIYYRVVRRRNLPNLESSSSLFTYSVEKNCSAKDGFTTEMCEQTFKRKRIDQSTNSLTEPDNTPISDTVQSHTSNDSIEKLTAYDLDRDSLNDECNQDALNEIGIKNNVVDHLSTYKQCNNNDLQNRFSADILDNSMNCLQAVEDTFDTEKQHIADSDKLYFRTGAVNSTHQQPEGCLFYDSSDSLNSSSGKDMLKLEIFNDNRHTVNEQPQNDVPIGNADNTVIHETKNKDGMQESNSLLKYAAFDVEYTPTTGMFESNHSTSPHTNNGPTIMTRRDVKNSSTPSRLPRLTIKDISGKPIPRKLNIINNHHRRSKSVQSVRKEIVHSSNIENNDCFIDISTENDQNSEEESYQTYKQSSFRGQADRSKVRQKYVASGRSNTDNVVKETQRSMSHRSSISSNNSDQLKNQIKASNSDLVKSPYNSAESAFRENKAYRWRKKALLFRNYIRDNMPKEERSAFADDNIHNNFHYPDLRGSELIYCDDHNTSDDRDTFSTRLPSFSSINSSELSLNRANLQKH